MSPANNSLERTQPQRGFKYDVAVLRRSARGRYPPSAPAGIPCMKPPAMSFKVSRLAGARRALAPRINRALEDLPQSV